ncbi:NUDIX hydrolase [Aquibacillus koreensis]|uniref:NUDIX hydrolase n=1 Tax=Aquibacillus koreensis TaxID=279446 RepID=A0A9X3WFJ8_9BACI|nr:NUDIX hydrolase [Aquibacillus koreensis]MCT2537456.1 NUDIX hydrolase [Aquibacillus koreensis]MDC3418902.1 NUDIX hydrolase [Aquibacillus koreensis]
MDKFEEKTTKTTEIFDGKIIKLQVDDVTLPDGKTSKREIVKHPGAVAVIALTSENKVVMVEQYRKPLEKSLVEIPAGKLEPGEKPEITAIRELEEETGYTTNNLAFVTSFYTSPGFADEILYLYFTDNLIPLVEEKDLDEDEFVELMEVTIEEAETMINEQKIHDAKTAYAIQYLRLRGLR